MANKFLLHHDPCEEEILIPIKDICKVVLNKVDCTIDIHTFGGAHYYEDNFSSDGTQRLARFIEILAILNDQKTEQEVWDYITNLEEGK